MTPLSLVGLIVGVALLSGSAAALLTTRSARRRSSAETELLLHSLKNPVQSILLHSDLLSGSSAVGDAERAELCAAIASEAQRLASLMARHQARLDRGARRDLVAGSGPLDPASDAAVPNA